MIYVARKIFVNEGITYLPGDVIEGVETWPRPESVVRAGYVVLQESPSEPVEVKPVRATRKPKE